MDRLVTIKSNRYGLEVYLNPHVPFEDLLEGVASKLKDSAKFFEGSKMAVTFLERRLSNEEEQAILSMIAKTTQINIVCIIDRDADNEMIYKNIVDHSLANVQKRDGQFYRGTLRKGEVLESDSSMIILGDVEQGAKIIAKGNIVVVGSLHGWAHAGASGDREAFVVAWFMKPEQLGIGDVEAKHQVICQESLGIRGPKIAVVDGHRIYVDPIVE